MDVQKTILIQRFLMFVFLTLISLGLQAENRQALLIANGAYKNFGALETPVPEAQDLATTLKGLGFQVTLLKNASREEMLDALDAFGSSLKGKGGIAFFHYGGHGVQVAGKNYLIPADADIPDDRKVSTRAVDLEEVMTTMDASGADTSIVILDACRNDPLPSSSGRAASRGLTVVESQPKNSIIVYSAQANSIAQDGLFTPALTKALEKPGLSLTDILAEVRSEVYLKSKGAQTPGEYNQLFTPVFLAGSGPVPGPAVTVVPVQPSVTPTITVSRSYGSLSITTVTAGTLYLDGKAMGDLPAGANAKLDSVEDGERSLEVRYAGGQVEKHSATVNKGEATSVSFTYRKTLNAPFSELGTSIAGNGMAGYSGDGAAAVSAELRNLEGVAVDSSGNLYIADFNNNVIRKVSTNGIITTVAGNGMAGYYGDGAAAIAAELEQPRVVAVDSFGNLYIADTFNNRVRKVSRGIITTVAGSGMAGYSGNGGIATSATFRFPVGLAVDSSGNLYIGDANNNVIRKVSTNGIITTVAGNGKAGYSGDGGAATSAELNGPSGLALDSSGNLYIADAINHVIRELKTSGIITTVAGKGTAGYSGDGGAATSAELQFPRTVAVDSTGTLYIADTKNSVIRKVSGGIITTMGGNGGIEVHSPWGVAVDPSGNLYIGDTGSNRVLKATVGPISPHGAQEAKHYQIGDTGPAGGIIFFDKGNDNDGWRYLEAATEDIADVPWSLGNPVLLGVKDTAIGSGRANTAKIVSSQGPGKYAASVCANYSGGGYSDWFLPSSLELRLMYTNLHLKILGNFAPYIYWSSSEYSTPVALTMYFGTGITRPDWLKTNIKDSAVRPIREVSASGNSVMQ